MIKEDNCKCCNEVWYKSILKEGLCPNCYYYIKRRTKELENQLKQKFENMSMTDFIRMAKKNGYKVQVNEDVDCEPNNKKFAIECLKEVKECFLSGVLMFDINSNLTEIEQDILLEHYEEDKRILADIIDNKIKELEEKNDILRNKK